MATTVNAKIFSHHEKADGTFNVKYVIYHNGERKFVDSPHFISKRQLNKDFEIKDKFVLKWLDEQLEDYRVLISSVGPRLNFFTCEQLRDFLRDHHKDIDIIEFVQIYSISEEAGERWNILDSMGKIMRGFDSKGNVFRYEYDVINRPSKVFVKSGAALEVNIEKTVYGDGQTNDKLNNLRGRAYRVYNAAGISTSDVFDFKGNLLSSSSQLCSDYKNDIDWNADPVLEAPVFRSLKTYDGHNYG